MKYWSTTEFTNWDKEWMFNWKVRLLYALLFFIPKSNPDNEKLYPQVSEWWVEIDDDGFAVREIALDKSGSPLFRAPDERNFGLWTDSEKITGVEESNISSEDFEEMWKRAARL